jgi:hypothetical protein
MDKLGNRTKVNVREGNDVAYSVDNLTNRYKSIIQQADVAHWRMDDNEPNTTVIDWTGNGHTGTAQRNTSVLYVDSGNPPYLNGVLIFDNGQDDYIDFGDITLSGDFTIAAWLYPDTWSNKPILGAADFNDCLYTGLPFAMIFYFSGSA